MYCLCCVNRQRTKRPEMQIYVPRGRRLQQRTEGESVTTSSDNTAPTLNTSLSTDKTSSNHGTNSVREKSIRSNSLVYERRIDGDKVERRSLSPQVGRGRAKPSRPLYACKPRPPGKEDKQDGVSTRTNVRSDSRYSIQDPVNFEPGAQPEKADSSELMDTSEEKAACQQPVSVSTVPPGGQKEQDSSVIPSPPTDYRPCSSPLSETTGSRGENNLSHPASLVTPDQFEDAVTELTNARSQEIDMCRGENLNNSTGMTRTEVCDVRSVDFPAVADVKSTGVNGDTPGDLSMNRTHSPNVYLIEQESSAPDDAHHSCSPEVSASLDLSNALTGDRSHRCDVCVDEDQMTENVTGTFSSDLMTAELSERKDLSDTPVVIQSSEGDQNQSSAPASPVYQPASDRTRQTKDRPTSPQNAIIKGKWVDCYL